MASFPPCAERETTLWPTHGGTNEKRDAVASDQSALLDEVRAGFVTERSYCISSCRISAGCGSVVCVCLYRQDTSHNTDTYCMKIHCTKYVAFYVRFLWNCFVKSAIQVYVKWSEFLELTLFISAIGYPKLYILEIRTYLGYTL